MFSRTNIRIENARLYPSEVVDRLYAALSRGAELHSYESRMNFYDVNSEGPHVLHLYLTRERKSHTNCHVGAKTRVR